MLICQSLCRDAPLSQSPRPQRMFQLSSSGKEICFSVLFYPLRPKYSRNYLTGSNDVPYYRLAMAIYDGNGLVTDQGILEEVYVKYKLSAIL